ncbi:hydantoinase/oxoprolinase family protein [Acidisphaera sp. S103]|uniref:hydantoinase/oxoprolinase family protein n=1 Tax=Acidisphaera sp. S103 TaxID=1747223 RepID=UPI00131D6A13|nr:hydantoinase/oxoprolinase family protein [Acidisphaera sp. S103]
MKLAFDTGGTFTDLALLDDAGVVHPHKVLSTPDDPSRAVLQGIDELLAMCGGTGRDVTAIFGATTVVTNAVLERKGAVTALITTDGFQDILRIRTEGRYDLYDLKLQFSEPLVLRQNCFGAKERVSVDGTILRPLDEAGITGLADKLKTRGIEAIAVCLLHSYRYGNHEARIRTLLQTRLPGVSVSLSSVVCPEIREYDRASTTVVNAYTRPLMAGHVKQLEGELAQRGTGQLLWMTSSGGVVPGVVASTLPVRMIESGPAAGVVASGEYARRSGDANLLSFDMGGTTAKLCMLLDGEPRIVPELEVAHAARFRKGSGLPLKIQSVQMIEIGAGGGSIASVGALGLLAVGPRSAAAAPGPACYGLGGEEPTVTDTDLVLGYLAAPVAVDVASSVPLSLNDCSAERLDVIRSGLVRDATPAIEAAGLSSGDVKYSFSADMRHVGQGYEINIRLPALEVDEARFKAEVAEAFRKSYLALYGRSVVGTGIEVITWRLRASGPVGEVGSIHAPPRADGNGEALRGYRSVYFSEAADTLRTPVYDHYMLRPGQSIAGPAIVEQRESTAVIGPRGSATLDARSNLVITLS